MKKITFILLSLIISSCHSQDKETNKNKPSTNQVKPVKLEIAINPKTMETHTTEKFDIENYRRHRSPEEGSYAYVRNDGAYILQADYENGYSQSITPKNSLFTIQKEYYKNGLLKSKWETFGEGGFIKGLHYEYDLSGKLIKAEDYDKPFKFKWEQVKRYIEQDLKLDLLKDKVGIGNSIEGTYYDIDYNNPTWSINYIGKYKDNPKGGIIRITLNGMTGELLHVEAQKGKGGEGTTVDVLYKKKN